MRETDLARVRRILAIDPIWATYALADLQPHLAPDCVWLTPPVPRDDALALVYRGLEPPILVTVGEPQALSAVLAAAWANHDLPPAIYASVRQEHLPVVARYYEIAADRRPMLRMHLVDFAAAQASAQNGELTAELPPVMRLTGADAGAVLRLLAAGGPFTPDAFSPAQMDAGVFFGVYAGTELVAVGGTHVVDYAQGIAAIGNMYTHPGFRRRGFSAAVLRSIVGELLARGVSQIVLNVDQRNTGAHALYLAHGFVVHVPYFEGKGNCNVVRVL